MTTNPQATTAIRLHAGGHHLTLISTSDTVTDYTRRSFNPWWKAFEVPAATAWTGPLISADIDASTYTDLRTLVESCPHQHTTYADAKTLVAHDSTGTITAVSPEPQLAYQHYKRSNYLILYGTRDDQVALAAARIARDALSGTLAADGWTQLRASAAVRDGQCVLTLSPQAAGRTTTALALATRGWQLLATDRVLVRPAPRGTLDVLPWPSPAAIGLDVLDALGWSDVIRMHLQERDRPHPAQHPDVAQALRPYGRGTFQGDDDGHSGQKAQVLPEQFRSRFGLDLATAGRASTLLFPYVDPAAQPAALDRHCVVVIDDFLPGATEHRDPDLLGLAPTDTVSDHTRQAVTTCLARLPHHSIRLGRDLTATADFLASYLI
ncbi:hypothetical protein [Streptomyces sp. NPDC016845]|uniref:hypothetical protein n=1 Tax=Streptomyces sp. NPDC016845 TaxID=3364972 RepID=UPI0037909BCA